jgi:protease-4
VLATVAIIFGSCALSLVAISGGSSKTSGGFGDKIAVIHIDGVIAGTGSSSGGVITPEEFRKQLRQAENDSDVKALVLRVDSPGGTVAASEEIATYVRQSDLPVVVSIGDVGASGAYMISSQADRIFALPGSAVGSIGVISEIPNVSGLLNKVGVDFQVITAGELKDTGSPYRSLTTTEKALIKGQVDQAYRQFVDIVAAGRNKQLKKSDVEKLATGWAWNGDEAKRLGLVDKIGTYQDALDEAARLGKIEGDYKVVNYETETLQDVLGGLFSISSKLDKLDALTNTDPASATRSSLPR